MHVQGEYSSNTFENNFDSVVYFRAEQVVQPKI
jgi:hypothetical protein